MLRLWKRKDSDLEAPSDEPDAESVQRLEFIAKQSVEDALIPDETKPIEEDAWTLAPSPARARVGASGIEMPDIKKLKDDIKLSKEKLKKFDVYIKSNVFIDLDGEKINILNSKEENRELICSMDNRLLRRILDRKSHWNNAAIGTHITFKRTPNKMEPDVDTLMSFFHL